MKNTIISERIILIVFMIITLALLWVTASNSAKEYGENVCEVTTNTKDCEGVR
jgi:hypothetical protein